ncbi:MAG: molybdopterin biosynthesis protein [Deltaproteobacteria bacterium]|nr:molybdopterin biosynthesis protein [Deltaproteobacteria bacterium]
MARKRYLKKTPLSEARDLLLAAVDPTTLVDETVAVKDALHRITSEPIFAAISSPHYHSAAMDGICVRARDTFDATEFAPKRLTLAASEAPQQNCFRYVDTGNALPSWSDAVVMIEKVRQIDPNTVEIFESTTPWQNVRLVGEDVVATEPLLPRCHRLRPYDLGALLAAGHVNIRVKRRPRVAIIPTGDELVLPGKEARPGEIIEFNSTVLAALVQEWGGDPSVCPPVMDDPAKLKSALEAAVSESDMVTIIAGSSAGEHDYTAEIVQDAGRLLVHGIDIMPGKPAVLGAVHGKPVVGIPGYPVSAIVAAREIMEPALEKFLGAKSAPQLTIRAMVPKKIPSRLGLEEFVRVNLGRVRDGIVAVPLRRGAGVITTMVQADGLLRIPSMVEGVNAGEELDIELLRSPQDIENTILCTGSHDLTIGILEDQLKRRYPALKIASTNVGSLGGLFALQRGETHMAGTHLLDPGTGTYNVEDIKRTLPDLPVILVHLVRREQGLMVPKGNPKNIRSLKDLLQKGVRFINRQPGSGTRVLLDYELERLSIDPAAIGGYQREEFTHMGVAVSIRSGLADVGLGVRSAANALELEFMPVGEEQYDLLLLKTFLDSEKGQRLLEAICCEDFRRAVENLGGYDAGKSGEILYSQ